METKPICRITHRQLLSGECPWCDESIVGGQVTTAAKDCGRVWNIEVLESDLAGPDREVRMATVGNFLSHGPSIDVAIPLLEIALHDSDSQIREHAGHALSSLGRGLSDESATELESQVNSSDHQLALRSVLVGYYSKGQFESSSAKLARRTHILWLIDNAAEMKVCGQPDCLLLSSDDPDAYLEAKERWLAHVERAPNNAAVLANAASFFTLNDPVLSEQLLIQGRSLEPDEPHWHEQLGQLYSLRSHTNDQLDELAAAQSFAAYREAERVTETQQAGGHQDVDQVEAILSRIHSLPDLARSALDASEFENATNYASELLSLANSSEIPEYFRNDGNAIHYGNMVLGRVALEMGDIETAKTHLLASGRTEGSPNLMSFGPNMTLAKRLLERGERDVVLEYFELCSEFWELGAEELEEWAADVKRGSIPDFGANLAY